jgi:phosphopentomutase
MIGLQRNVTPRPDAFAARLTARSAGKDTTTGHWELMGLVLNEPFTVFESFPAWLVEELEQRGGVRFIGNKAASGTDILRELGPEHHRTGNPILYTSADSVLQIAAHEQIFGLQRLWDLCRTARTLLDERGIRIGRVIARPFIGDPDAGFTRTANRHDYSLTPSGTALNRLQAAGIHTVGVGKISDIFAGSGIAESHPTVSNTDGMNTIERLWDEPCDRDRFILANLVDFDSLFGHRRDPGGYARCLREFDNWLGTFLEKIGKDDLCLITADHGNDPYHSGTDHTREQVPLLALGPVGDRSARDFGDVAALVESYFR